MYQPTNIMPIEEIHSSLEEIQAALEAHYEADNPDAVVARMAIMEGYMALSGKMLADAKHHHRKLTESSIMLAITNAEKQRMTPTTLNKYIESITRDYAYLVDWCERCNRACTHSIDAARTIISKLKEEIKLAGYAGR